MLKFGNKEFRNLQEQVYANMKDIAKMKEGVYVLDEFGIKVVGEVESLADLPTVAEYKEEHEDWAYGDAYAVGTEAPYALYILTRANSENPDDYWFDIGEFPMPGPQGETGAQGPVGPQGPQGNTGASGTPAGFGTITATAETLVPGSSATATVVASGPDSEKSFAFTFGIPRGQDGDDLDVSWGEIQGTLSDQTDLQDALDDKQDAILNYDSSTANSVTFKDNIILKNESNQTTTIGRASGLAISTDQVTILNASNDAIIPNLNIRPLRDNAISIGNDISRIKDIKMAGVIGDGTHTFTLPSNTGTLLTNNDLNGYATQTWVNQQGFITGITSSDVISALGYTPYNSSNPNGYISGITSSMVTTALGYTPGTSNFSGSYNDLSDKPTIPSVSGTNDGTNWTSITIDSDTYAIPVGGSGGISDVTLGGTSVVTNNVAVLPAYPVVPTTVSSFTNDAGYITSASIPTNYVTTDTNQTITGAKTFTQGVSFANGVGASLNDDIQDVNTLVWGIATNNTPAFKLNSDNHGRLTINSEGLIICSNPNSGSGINASLQLPSSGTSSQPAIIATRSDIPTVPTKVSDLTNDAGYITSSDISNMVTTDGQQTISGIKTFEYGKIRLQDGLYNNRYTTLYRGNAQANNEITFPDNSGTLALTSDIPTNNNQLTNGAGYQTASDVATAISSQTKETWTFTLSDGTTVTKKIVLG